MSEVYQFTFMSNLNHTNRLAHTAMVKGGGRWWGTVKMACLVTYSYCLWHTVTTHIFSYIVVGRIKVTASYITLVSYPVPTRGEGVWCHKSKSLGVSPARGVE